MKKGIKMVVVLNEKEAGVIFPRKNNEVDLSKMFYSTDSNFHEWCLDYFNYSWKNSNSFQEHKLKVQSPICRYFFNQVNIRKSFVCELNDHLN